MADQIFNVKCGFFDAVNYDRTYTADDMNKPYSRIVADGVFATNQGTPSTDLQTVSAGNGMQITVQAGQGIFARKWFENQSSIIITVPNNTSINPRIDSVLVQIDKRVSGRVGNIVYRTGTPGTNAAVPPINQLANVIEYRLANINVAPGATTINNDVITDLRGSASCPWVTGLITQVDTSALWQQFQTAYQNQYDKYTTDYQNYVNEQRQAWEDFVRSLTDDLTVSTNVVMLDSSYTAAASVTNIPINIASYNQETDILQVFINGLFAAEGDKYTINPNGTSITLTNAIAAGNSVYFVVFKSLIGGDIESSVSMMQRLDDKINNFMSDSGWINLELENGAQAYDSDSTPGVRCMGNRVYLRGAVANLTSDLTFCTLPLDFVPAIDHVYTTTASSDSSGTANDYITITISATTGAVKMTSKSGTIASTDKISIATSFLAATGNSVGMIYNYKGFVNTYANLPTTGVKAGDVYMILSADMAHNIAAGDDVLWNGAEWEILTSAISSFEIDQIINNVS